MTLDDIEHLAHSLPPDTRPTWLRAMPSASDDTALYYRFFDALVTKYAPLRVLELGTYKATSAAHLAFGNVGGAVYTIDSDPAARAYVADVYKQCAAEMGCDTHNTLTLDTGYLRDDFDVLLIDTLHTYAQAMAEFRKYGPLVRDGGFIFFDDISLGDEMPLLWAALPEPKRRLDVLHYTGFGVVEVSRG